MSFETVGIENLPNVYIKNIRLYNELKKETGNYKLTVEVVIKDFKNEFGDLYWSSDSLIRNNLNIMVFLSHSERLTRAITNGELGIDPSEILKGGYSHNDFQYSTISVKSKEVTKEAGDDGNIYSSLFSCGFKVKEGTPPPALFAASYINFDRIVLTLGGTSLNNALYFGPIVSDLTSPEATARIFLKSNGSIYTGPVHQHEGTFMAGSRHTSTPHDLLRVVDVLNTKVKDYRILDFSKKKTKKKNKKDSFFSELLTTPDVNKFARLMFLVDSHKVMLLKTKYGHLIQNFDIKSYEEILAKFQIKNISIYRNKILPSIGSTKFLSKKIVKRKLLTNEQIATARDQSSVFSGTARFKDKYPQGEHTIIDTPLSNVDFKNENFVFMDKLYSMSDYKMISNIEEVFFEGIKSPHRRAFVVNDLSFVTNKNSYYQYYTKASFKDPTIKYVHDLLQQIQSDISKISSYVKNVTSIKNYNFKEKKVRREFRLQIDDSSWNPIVERYLKYYSFLYDVTTDQLGELRTRLKSYINPISLTIDSSKKFIKKYRDMYTNIVSYFGTKTNRRFFTNLDARQKIHQKNIIPDIEITHYFKDILNFGNIEYGYDYHNIEDTRTSGLIQYGFSEFGDRITQEEEKYRSNSMAESSLKKLPKPAKDGMLDLVGHRTTYITPKVMYSPRHQVNVSNPYSIKADQFNSLKSTITPSAGTNSSTTNNSSPGSAYLASMGPGSSLQVNNTPSHVGGNNSPWTISSVGSSATTIHDAVKDTMTEDIDFIESSKYLGIDSPFSYENQNKKNKSLKIPIERIQNLMLNSYNLTNAKKSSMFNLQSSSNVFLGKNMTFQKAQQIPNQIKNLIGDLKIVGNTIDIMALPEISSIVDVSYFTIQKIETLVGFRSSQNGEGFFPIWRKLTSDVVERLRASPGDNQILCRMHYYTDPSLNIDIDQHMKLNVYNNLFFIQSPGEAIDQSSPETTEEAINIEMYENTEYITTNIVAQNSNRDGMNKNFDYREIMNNVASVATAPSSPTAGTTQITVAMATTTGGSTGGY